MEHIAHSSTCVPRLPAPYGERQRIAAHSYSPEQLALVLVPAVQHNQSSSILDGLPSDAPPQSKTSPQIGGACGSGRRAMCVCVVVALWVGLGTWDLWDLAWGTVVFL